MLSRSDSVLGGVAGVIVTIDAEAGILGSLAPCEGERDEEADTELVVCGESGRGHDVD